MSSGALITMIIVQVAVTLVTIYFFSKVLRSSGRKHKQLKKEDLE